MRSTRLSTLYGLQLTRPGNRSLAYDCPGDGGGAAESDVDGVAGDPLELVAWQLKFGNVGARNAELHAANNVEFS